MAALMFLLPRMPLMLWKACRRWEVIWKVSLRKLEAPAGLPVPVRAIFETMSIPAQPQQPVSPAPEPLSSAPD